MAELHHVAGLCGPHCRACVDHLEVVSFGIIFVNSGIDRGDGTEDA